MAISVEVVLSPALLPFYDVKDKVVVVIDILRATTSICVAFKTGVKRIIPVSTPEEAAVFRDFDFICAAERNAARVPGFDMGNSPAEFENALIRDRHIAFTTTNGTRAIKDARRMGASSIWIGSFLNISALCRNLVAAGKPVVLLCAGWKDKVNMEDTVFAGAVLEKIGSGFEKDCDSAKMAEELYRMVGADLESFVRRCAHAKRFSALPSANDDIAYSVRRDIMDIVPVLDGEYITSGSPGPVHG